jgi:hypothetical protein
VINSIWFNIDQIEPGLPEKKEAERAAAMLERPSIEETWKAKTLELLETEDTPIG